MRVAAAAIVLWAALAPLAGAQELPQFMPEYDVEVIGAYGDRSLIVRNNGATFLCGVERIARTERKLVPAWSYTACRPIVSRAEAQAAGEAITAVEEAESAAADTIQSILRESIVAGLRERGCAVVLSSDAEYDSHYDRLDEIAADLAAERNAELPEGDALEDAYRAAYEALDDRIEWEPSTSTERLVDCDPAEATRATDAAPGTTTTNGENDLRAVREAVESSNGAVVANAIKAELLARDCRLAGSEEEMIVPILERILTGIDGIDSLTAQALFEISGPGQVAGNRSDMERQTGEAVFSAFEAAFMGGMEAGLLAKDGDAIVGRFDECPG